MRKQLRNDQWQQIEGVLQGVDAGRKLTSKAQKFRLKIDQRA